MSKRSRTITIVITETWTIRRGGVPPADETQDETHEKEKSLTQLQPVDVETVNRIQENLIAYFRVFAGLPGVTFVEEEVTWNVGGPGPHILHTHFPSDGVEPGGVDQQIDDLIRQIGQFADSVDWFVFPTCQPTDLGERVAAHGLAGGPDGAWTLVGQSGGPGGNWMIADLTALPDAPPVSDRFHIETVCNEAMLGEWLQVSLTGFGNQPPTPEQWAENYFYAGYTRHGFDTDASSLHYIGYLDDQPVTAATLLLAGGIAGLFDISTPAAFRRQGFGSAISWHLLQEAHRRGYQQAYVWSSALGKGVYPRVGFVPVALGMREYCWQKR
jgi:GNAT superfamily N-acetyltransferase